MIDGPSGDSTGFVRLFTSQRFLAVVVFLSIVVLFIFLSLLLFHIYHSQLYLLLAAGTFVAPKAVIIIIVGGLFDERAVEDD